MMGSNFIALSLAIILNAVIEQPQPIEGATLDTQYMYVRQDPIQYWVDDGCVTGGRDKDGSFKKTTDLAGVRCCSDDGSTCETPGDCPAHNMPFDNAKQKCAQLGKRLCTKDQLLSGVCCGTGGMCDYDEIWTSDIAKSQCKDVTFGECPISTHETFLTTNTSNAKLCYRACASATKCSFYRFNRQTKECKLMSNGYRQWCRIRAAPMEKKILSCLMATKSCDHQIEEACEYTGNAVRKYPPGGITDDDRCQEECQNSAPTCKYWIYNIAERVCILKGESTRICNVTGGPKHPSYEECRDLLEDHEK